MAELDMVNRDPNNLNEHLKCQFEDVFGEPEGVHSIDFVWKMSYTCFNLWLNLCYKLATLFYGCCIAAEWGCEFAEIAFIHIWYITPLMRVLDIECAIWKKLMRQCTTCCCEPCCEAFGGIFYYFKK